MTSDSREGLGHFLRGDRVPAAHQSEGPSDAALFARMHTDGDQRAREALIERYLPLARRLARRYQRTEEPMDDLVQVASLGLIKAVDRFDAGREILFSTTPCRPSSVSSSAISAIAPGRCGCRAICRSSRCGSTRW